jgi:hypothetical protein
VTKTIRRISALEIALKKGSLIRTVRAGSIQHGPMGLLTILNLATQKSTVPHYFTVPNTDRTQLIPRISVSL